MEAPGGFWGHSEAPGAGELRSSGRFRRAPEGSRTPGGSEGLLGAPGGSGELQGAAGGSRDVCRGAVAASFAWKRIEFGRSYVHRCIENILIGRPVGCPERLTHGYP